MNSILSVRKQLRLRFKRVLISRSFSRVLLGQIVSVTGSNATAVIVPLIAVITLNASSFEVGVLNAAKSLAAAILGIRIGRWCDRIGPDRTMLVSNLTGAFATIALFIVLYKNVISFPLLLALLLLIGIAELGFDISRTGYTVALVPKNRLPHANALIEGANAVGEGIGPSIGGWLFGALGAALSLLLDFVTYACSSLLVLFNILEHRKRTSGQDCEEGKSDHAQFDGDDGDSSGTWQGIRFVWKSRILRSIAFSAGQFNFFTAAFSRSIMCSWFVTCTWTLERSVLLPRAVASEASRVPLWQQNSFIAWLQALSSSDPSSCLRWRHCLYRCRPVLLPIAAQR